METYLPISYLNDYVFCPYSIYLHQVFDSSEEIVYSASPQQTGKTAHQAIDAPPIKQSKQILKSAYVISNQLGLYGKIDTFYIEKKHLVESKFKIKTFYRGYFYQLWAQYTALTEMGYQVQSLAFFSINDRQSYPVNIPNKEDINELKMHIRKIARFNFNLPLNVNLGKCKHCIYASLCDKTEDEHVYS